MFSLSNISIKVKILVLFLIPTLALVYQVSLRSFEEYTSVQENKVVQSYVELAAGFASLVHESQKERGMTAGFLGSGGKKFANDLPTQRAATDAKAKALRLEVQHLQKMHLNEPAEFKSDLEASMNKLSNLQSLRSQVTALSIPKAKALAFYYYEQDNDSYRICYLKRVF